MDVLLNNDVETVDFGESAMRVKLTREVIEVKEINDIGSVRILMLKGEKGDVGYPTDEQVSEAVDEWLTAHPEATTTVQDNSLTWVKFNDVLKNMMFQLGITDSKSGELVSTSDAAEFPLKDLQSEITATQNLNGYEYPWVGGAGKNKLPPFSSFTENGITATVDSNGIITLNGTATADITKQVAVNAPSGDYCFSINNTATVGTGPSNTIYFYVVDAGGSWVANPMCYHQNAVSKGTSQNGTTLARMVILSGVTVNNFVIKPQFEQGSTATAYAPYENICPITGRNTATVYHGATEQTAVAITTALGRTVYGGTLDLTTGVLTVNTGYIASYNGETIGEPWISDRDRYVAGTTPTIGAQVVYTKDSETYQVDRTEVDAYFKNNTIWSDSGDVTVSYLVDAKTYIDNQ